jgi:hypothetical protein
VAAAVDILQTALPLELVELAEVLLELQLVLPRGHQHQLIWAAAVEAELVIVV